MSKNVKVHQHGTFGSRYKCNKKGKRCNLERNVTVDLPKVITKTTSEQKKKGAGRVYVVWAQRRCLVTPQWTAAPKCCVKMDASQLRLFTRSTFFCLRKKRVALVPVETLALSCCCTDMMMLASPSHPTWTAERPRVDDVTKGDVAARAGPVLLTRLMIGTRSREGEKIHFRMYVLYSQGEKKN